MVGENLDPPNNGDVAFKLSFPKCRRRKPDIRHNFEPVEIAFEQGQWLGSAASTSVRSKKAQMTATAVLCLDALERALAKEGKQPPSWIETKGVSGAVPLVR